MLVIEGIRLRKDTLIGLLLVSGISLSPLALINSSGSPILLQVGNVSSAPTGMSSVRVSYLSYQSNLYLTK